jgi:hypothetical protein
MSAASSAVAILTLVSPKGYCPAHRKGRPRFEDLYRKRSHSMKKLMLTLLIVVIAVPPAKATLKANVHAGVTYTFTIEDGTGGTAVMLQELVRGRLDVVESLTVGHLDTVQFTYTVPRNAERVILVFDPSSLIAATKVTVNDPTSQVMPTESFVADHVQLVFDVTP